MQIGTAMADITGPAADVNFMGYAMLGQVAGGVHFRQRARAFVTLAPGADGAARRFAFVSADIGMGSSAMNEKVLEALEADNTTKGLFSKESVGISGTHTHSAPAGFLTHMLFQVSSLGFIHQTFDAYVQGIAQAIIKANANLRPAKVLVNRGKVAHANINRSPTSYLRNPAAERAMYEDGDTDHDMTLLKFVDAASNAGFGMYNWYAVHGTSMNNTNGLISGDNKGWASYLFEKAQNPPGTRTGEGAFVAAFAATNLGDVSPNINGTYCMDTGLPCDRIHSTCNNKTEMCVGRGPGKDMIDSTRIIAERQYEVAQKLYDSATEELTGPVDMRQTYVDMSQYSFPLADGTNVTTCDPAMGYAFAAGTTDGPGMFNFVQGTNSTNPFWNAVSHLLSKPTAAQTACHHPKPILLNVGGMSKPYPWAATVVPVMVQRMGRFFLVNVPSEFTTMAGRRMRAAVAAEVTSLGLLPKGTTPVVVIAGLSNDYADYTTTYEEYQAQRYEAASTIFGPHELDAFIHIARGLVQDMAKGRPSASLPPPAADLSKMISLLPGVIFDSVPLLKKFGDVTTQPPATVARGTRVAAVFRTANPRNNLRTGGTFLTVERQNNATGAWDVVAVDGDVSTIFAWARPHHSKISAESSATISWDVPADAAPGTYRIQHFNAHKNILGKITEFTGTSNPFQVV
eukprot:TRINITY_DN3867_c0_g1_i2.p1 TRINITY_DN3867_c0_g1~~TRINITY_DN3867_c0_g1_i2.p1  ORF type:complete len:725 (+),score=274.66 TRINITY_DN3867_c0_g1_i2:123-2177(+)